MRDTWDKWEVLILASINQNTLKKIGSGSWIISLSGMGSWKYFWLIFMGDLDLVGLDYNRRIFGNQGIFAHLVFNFFLQKNFILKCDL